MEERLPPRLIPGSVIPLYNSAKYLKDLTESIADQSTKLEELIFVDDGSTDSTVIVLSELIRENPEISRNTKLIRLEKNVGISTAFNIGLSHLTSNVIFFSGHDDVWRHGRVAETLEAFTSTKADLLYGSYQCFGKSNALQRAIPSSAALITGLLFGNCIGGPTVALNLTRISKDRIRFNPRMEGAEDYDLWCELIAAGAEPIGLESVLVDYRTSDTQLSKTFDYEKFPVHKAVCERFAINIFPGLSAADIGNLLTLIKGRLTHQTLQIELDAAYLLKRLEHKGRKQSDALLRFYDLLKFWFEKH